ncbi:hypothetical protein L1049_002588 [Liquidambar formosana]|uniref:Uncharacterized protein n=1 Tax=Liquidambar formosana TaxID=63359 RepID=A0AAP0R6U4_LIQFO
MFGHQESSVCFKASTLKEESSRTVALHRRRRSSLLQNPSSISFLSQSYHSLCNYISFANGVPWLLHHAIFSLRGGTLNSPSSIEIVISIVLFAEFFQKIPYALGCGIVVVV